MPREMQPPATTATYGALLFDLDGTLVDSAADLAAALNRALEQRSLPQHDLAAVRTFIGAGARKLVERALAAGGAAPSDAAPGDAAPSGAVPTEADVDAVLDLFRAAYRQTVLVHTRPYAGIEDLLRRVPEIPKAVTSNKPGEFTKAIINGLGWGRYFGAVFGGDCVARKKPDPLMLTTACETLGVRPSDALMIGDSPEDILAGRAAGATTWGVTWGFRSEQSLRDAGADRIIQSVHDLTTLLTRAA